MESWLIPAAPVTVVEEIKKSRFITMLAHTDGVEAAKAFVESVRAEHPDARHHCVAWVAGAPDDSQQLGFSDDGEPAGTAGKPMLAQLMGSGVGGNYRCGGCATTAAYCLVPVVSESVWRRRESGAAPANDPTQDAINRIYFAM